MSSSFCCCVSLDGNLISTPTMKSPLSFGDLLFGIPSPGKRSVHVGGVGPLLRTASFFSSIVSTVRDQPVKASFRSMVAVARISSPSRVKAGCAFYGHGYAAVSSETWAMAQLHYRTDTELMQNRYRSMQN